MTFGAGSGLTGGGRAGGDDAQEGLAVDRYRRLNDPIAE
jgi:hypothetical protein